MSKEITLIHYTDPGHGWTPVKIDVAEKYGFLYLISPYSYIKGNTIYLEEDGDLSLYCDAIRKSGDTFIFKNKSTDKRHPIRSYESVSKETIYKNKNK